MRFIPKNETIEKYGAILPDTLTNQAIKESDVYNTYHDFTTRKVIPKPKYVRRSTREKTDQAPTASPCKRLKATTKSSDEDDDDEVSLSKDDDENDDNKDDDGQDDDNEQTESDNDGDDFVHPKFSTRDEEERQDEKDKEEEGDNVKEEELDEYETSEEEEVNELYRDVNVNLEGRDTEMTDALLVNSSLVSSDFIFNMLNSNPDTSIDSILNLNIKLTSLVDVPVTSNVEMPPSSVTTLPPPPIPLIQPQQQTPVPTPTIIPSTSLQNLLNFCYLFKFEDRLKALEDDFSEFMQTNQFAEAVSSIPGIVDMYLANKMNEAIKTVVQLQSDILRSEAQADNEEFINKIDENIRKIIKEQVKVQVKEQVTKILPKIEKFVNDQLKAEVLIRSSNEAKTSYAVADILETYGYTVMFKRRRDDKDEDEEPSTGLKWGSKRRRPRKEPESTSVTKEKTSKSTGKSNEGSKSHQKSTGKSAQAEEPIHADEDLEEPAH
ncbi:hypothetical protein Tco_0008099 [Tanacetum coccineum]